MKVGDLVKMNWQTLKVNNGDIWGTGIILGICLDPYSACYNIEIWWSEMGIGWEMPEMLEVIGESR